MPKPVIVPERGKWLWDVSCGEVRWVRIRQGGNWMCHLGQVCQVMGEMRCVRCQVGEDRGSQVCSAATLCMLRLSLRASVSTRLFPLPVDENWLKRCIFYTFLVAWHFKKSETSQQIYWKLANKWKNVCLFSLDHLSSHTPACICIIFCVHLMCASDLVFV